MHHLGDDETFEYHGVRMKRLRKVLAKALDMSLQQQNFQSLFPELAEINPSFLDELQQNFMEELKESTLSGFTKVAKENNLREKLNILDEILEQQQQQQQQLQLQPITITPRTKTSPVATSNPKFTQSEEVLNKLHVEGTKWALPTHPPSIKMAQKRIELKTKEKERLQKQINTLEQENNNLKSSTKDLEKKKQKLIASCKVPQLQIEKAAQISKMWKDVGTKEWIEEMETSHYINE